MFRLPSICYPLMISHCVFLCLHHHCLLYVHKERRRLPSPLSAPLVYCLGAWPSLSTNILLWVFTKVKYFSSSSSISVCVYDFSACVLPCLPCVIFFLCFLNISILLFSQSFLSLYSSQLKIFLPLVFISCLYVQSFLHPFLSFCKHYSSI